ncbi:hypothetical protein ACFX58_19655 [Sphingomonas sp. NCPPB 2930]
MKKLQWGKFAAAAYLAASLITTFFENFLGLNDDILFPIIFTSLAIHFISTVLLVGMIESKILLKFFIFIVFVLIQLPTMKIVLLFLLMWY